MVTGISTFTSTINIRKKDGVTTGSDYTADIENFSETSTERKISYTTVIGGLIVPKVEETVFKEVTFDFIVGGVDVERFINDSQTTKVEEWNTVNQYRIALTFTGTAETYIKAYYNAYIQSIETKTDGGIVKASITFSLPMMTTGGVFNYYVFESTADLTTKDTAMGYA